MGVSVLFSVFYSRKNNLKCFFCSRRRAQLIAATLKISKACCRSCRLAPLNSIMRLRPASPVRRRRGIIFPEATNQTTCSSDPFPLWRGDACPCDSEGGKTVTHANAGGQLRARLSQPLPVSGRLRHRQLSRSLSIPGARRGADTLPP